jgi:predicted ferric reductase
MRKLLFIIIGFMAVITGIWWMADSLLVTPFSFQAFQVPFTQLSGVLATGMMAFTTLLAIRPKWLEPYLGGLDKMYWLHKWMSIVAMVFAIAHWQLASDGGHGRPPAAGETAAATTTAATPEAATSFFGSLQGPAHGLAQPALWILIALVLIALIKKIPYHIFALTHRLVPIIFLVLVFHSVVLMKSEYWTQPIGWLMAALFLVGTVASLIALFRLIGAGRRVQGKVTGKSYIPDVHSLLVEMELESGWKGHVPGQFAFVGSRKRWGMHPFTIASPWNAQTRRISFIVKELGDETEGLNERLAVGTDLVVEGPYGKFNFHDSKPLQIWVSGGIGISPFVARMKYLQQNPENKPIDLFHSDATRSEKAHELMKADATKSRVTLHITVTPEQGRMTGEKIRASVPDWQKASVWFCGPAAFAVALKRDLVSHGLANEDFHHEFFEMR